MHDAGPAVTRHPDDGGLDTGLEIPTPAAFLQEGIQRGEQLEHERENSRGGPGTGAGDGAAGTATIDQSR